jgi:hypothetical protein
MVDSPEIRKKELLGAGSSPTGQCNAAGPKWASPHTVLKPRSNIVKKGLGQNIVKKADGVGTVAHIVQKGARLGCRTHGIVMYDAAQTAPPTLRIVASRENV